MEWKEFLKKSLIDFLIIQAGITLAIGIIGCIKQPTTDFHYAGFFVPFLYAFFCLLPSVVTYSSYELSIKQMIVRKVIQLLLIEGIVLLISYIVGALSDFLMGMIIAFVVVIIYILANFIDYYIARSNAYLMTKKVKSMKKGGRE